jgi:hypothetical protein
VRHSARRGRRIDQVGDLVGAESDGQGGTHVRAGQLAGVHVEPAGGVDRDDGNVSEPFECRNRVGSQPRPAADSDDPVDGDVGGDVRTRLPHPTTGPSQSRQAAIVDVIREQPRLDRRPALRQRRTGVQRIAAVVARPDQQDHPPAVGTAQEVDHRVREPGRRLLHQCALGQGRHQRLFGGSDLLHGVRPAHAPTLSACRRIRRVSLSVRYGAL